MNLSLREWLKMLFKTALTVAGYVGMSPAHDAVLYESGVLFRSHVQQYSNV